MDKFKKNTGKSKNYKKIFKLIDEQNFTDLDEHIRINYSKNCYDVISKYFDYFKIKNNFHEYFYTSFKLNPKEYYDDFGDDDEKYYKLFSKDASIAPEEILKLSNIEDISLYFTGYNDMECILKYIFLKDCSMSGRTLIYCEDSAEIISNLFKTFDSNYIKILFNEMDKYWISNFTHQEGMEDFILLLRRKSVQKVLSKLMEFLSPKELASLFFTIVPKIYGFNNEYIHLNSMSEVYFHYYSILQYKPKNIQSLNEKIKNNLNYNSVLKNMRRISPHRDCYSKLVGNKHFYIEEPISYLSLFYDPKSAVKLIQKKGYPEVQEIQRLIIPKKARDKIEKEFLSQA